jgi:hypothetical protein
LTVETLERALLRVEVVLGRYPAPQTEPCDCDVCAEDARLILRGMGKRPSEVSPDEVRAAIWGAYSTWCADWPEIAHFVPAALRYGLLESAVDLSPDIVVEMLYKKLLVSARPDMDPRLAPATPMPQEDRRAIFDAVAALLLEMAASTDSWGLREELTSGIGFLAQFDVPILPVLEAWLNEPRSVSRARLCSVMAANALHNGRKPFFGNSYMGGAYQPMPENETAIAKTFAPVSVAQYLLDHTDDFAALSEEERYEVDLGWYAASMSIEG